MTTSNFSYLEREYPILFNIGQAAEYHLYADPVTSIFKIRQFTERLTEILFEEHHLKFPDDNTFHHRLKKLEFEGLLPFTIKDLFHVLKGKGNVAVHQNKGTVEDARSALFSAFKIAKWFYATYSRANQDIADVKFHVPENLDSRHALHLLEQQYRELETKFNQLLAERKTDELKPEQKQQFAQRSEEAVRHMDLSEAETRQLIDEQLRAAGWEADTDTINYKTKRTLPAKGRCMAIAEWKCDRKWADYALFIDTELVGIVEAKKHLKNVKDALGQAREYAGIVGATEGISFPGHPNHLKYKVPFVFATNGRSYLRQYEIASGIWFWDARNQRDVP